MRIFFNYIVSALIKLLTISGVRYCPDVEYMCIHVTIDRSGLWDEGINLIKDRRCAIARA